MTKKAAKPAPTPFPPLFTYLESSENSIVAAGELVIVNFAGLGGACVGIEEALNRPVTHAINHDPIAISLHRTNNPYTIHHVQDVWAVDPVELSGGRRIALAWFSPDCKHFSKAKGGKPVEKGIRDLAWVTTKYTALPDDVKPRVVFLENVEEFKTWGPLDADGHPCKVRQGETFREFVATLESHGYTVEHRELRACDYGAPTIRKRLFLIARCDGEAIVWPAPTHGHPDSPAVKAGQLLPWRTAAECIDWDLPTPSIFERRRPLVPATLRRVARGIKKFVLESEKPFIVTANHAGPGFRGQDIGEPMRTLTAAHDAHGIVDPLLAPLIANKQHQAPARSALAPLSTITTNHNKNELVTGALVGVGGRGAQARPKGLNECMHTITSKADMAYAQVTLQAAPFFAPRYGQWPGRQAWARSVLQPINTTTTTANNAQMAVAYLVRSGHYSNITGEGSHFRGQGFDQPLSTITAAGNDKMVTTTFLTKFQQHSVGQAPQQPLDTVLAGATRFGAASLFLTKFRTNSTGSSLNEPIHTITAGGEPARTSTGNVHGLLSASLIKHFGGFYQGAGSAMTAPVGTITANDHNGILLANLVRIDMRGFAKSGAYPVGTPIGAILTKQAHATTVASLVQYNGTAIGQRLDKPSQTIPTVDRFGLSLATLTRHFGTSRAASVRAPLGTVTTEGGGKTNVVTARALPLQARPLNAGQVFALLEEYAPDALTDEDRAAGMVFVTVQGERYVIADIGMRMLTPRELARCQGFRDTYVLEHTAEGKPISKAAQVRGVGNSVCPPIARALVESQFQPLPQAAD